MAFLFFFFSLFFESFWSFGSIAVLSGCGPTMFRWIYTTALWSNEYVKDAVKVVQNGQLACLNTGREEKKTEHEIVQLCHTTLSVRGNGVMGACPNAQCHDYEEKVELIAPNLIFEKVTVESALFFSTSAGAPESLAQVPRLTPGVLSVVFVG